MIKINCRQGSPEWLQARAGVITASEFSTATSVLTRNSGDKKPGDATETAEKYLAKVAAESILGEPIGEPVKAWVLDRGHALEDEARAVYMERTGSVVYEQGFVLDDSKTFGYSTDGEVDSDGLIEIKCPIDMLKIAQMIKTRDVSEYIHQIQGGMWITGRKWCDLIVYAPMLAPVGNDLIVTRIERDEEFLTTMIANLIKAHSRMTGFKTLFSGAV